MSCEDCGKEPRTNEHEGEHFAWCGCFNVQTSRVRGGSGPTPEAAEAARQANKMPVCDTCGETLREASREYRRWDDEYGCMAWYEQVGIECGCGVDWSAAVSDHGLVGEDGYI